jgi:predicted nucleic acid-binding protein
MVANRVFLDTSYVVALVNGNDQYHGEALTLSNQYENKPLITTEIILIEIGNALARGYKQSAVEIIRAIRSSGEVKLIKLDSFLTTGTLFLSNPLKSDFTPLHSLTDP